MGRYVVRRLLQMLLVALATTFAIYSLVWALPGDRFAGKCGQTPCTAAYREVMTARLHLDDPLPEQYLRYLGHLLQGDFGTTFAGRDIGTDLLNALGPTVRLTTLAIGFEILIGITAGVLAGLRRGGFLDSLVLMTTIMVVSIPVFVIGFSSQYFFGVRLGWVSPTVGRGAPWSQLILPALVLASLSLAYVARLTRTTLAENLRTDYVRTAVAKGLSRSRVVTRHALRNSLVPVITFIGGDFGVLLGGAIVTEGIFNIQGIGGLTARAILRHEGAAVTGVITVLVLAVLLVNLLVDLLYAALDPRIRYE